MKFGKIETLLLLGGGRVMLELARHAKATNLKIAIFTSPRHKDELIGGKTLGAQLEEESIACYVTENIGKEPAIKQFLGDATMALSFGAAWIFKKSFIDLLNGKLLNVHGARLPVHRGAGGFSWRILMDDRKGASLIHFVTEEIDAGDIVCMADYDIPASCQLPAEWDAYQQDKDIEFLKQFLQDIEDEKEFTLQEQDEAKSTYFPRLHTPTHAAIDWRWSAAEIDRFIKAFDTPYPGAFTMQGDERFILRDCESEPESGFHPFQSGLIYRIHGGRVYIVAGTGAISVGKVLSAQGEDTSSSLRVGYRFHTPAALLEKANAFRAVYTPTGIKP